MKLTQNERIYRALKAGRTLTMLDGFKLCGTMNLHKRISELDTSDWLEFDYEQIKRIWVKRNGRKIRAWRLA